MKDKRDLGVGFSPVHFRWCSIPQKIKFSFPMDYSDKMSRDSTEIGQY
jgi:hypothetical protein